MSKDHSFEPRIGTAQFFFGIFYIILTLITLVFAINMQYQGNDATVQYIISGLFFVLTLKSFIIFKRVKNLVKTGVKVNAKFKDIEYIRGITTVYAQYELENYGIMNIQEKLAGESVFHEIKNYLKDNNTDLIPAIIVDSKGKKPRGMLCIRTISGHLDIESIKANQVDSKVE